MQTQVGVIKQISGLVVAIDQNGVSRVLKAGDALYLGEVIKTSSASSKAVVLMDNGKDVTILGDETFKLDEVASNQNANTVADVSDLQKALLDGKDLSNLEETAAGGNAAAGGGDGVSLGAASFDQGGHYSNISENFRPIGDLNNARGAERIGGISGGADNAGGAAASDPELSRKPTNPGVKYPEDKDGDGKISFDENKPNNGGDNTPNKTTVEITIPNDGSVKPGDNLKVTDPEGNVVVDRPVTQDDIDKGKVVVPNIPVKPGNNTTTAEITNPNNPNNKGIGTGDIDENSEGSRKPTNPGVKYPEDKDGDGKISFDENKPNNGGDNTPNKTTVEITIPNDGSVKPGDNLKVTDPEGNVVVDRPVTQDDIDKGKVVVPNIPVKPGNNTTTAEITNPNNPNNKGIGTGDIDENSEGSRKPTNPGVKYPEDKDGDGKISFDENKPNNGGDNTPNKTTVEITIPNDGSVKPGDNLKVTDPEGNVVVDRPVTQDDIDKGKVVVPNIPVKPGNNTTTAEITNPNNPNNKGIGTGDIDENSEGSRKPTNPGVKYPEDKDGDGKISFDENKPNNGGDNTPNKTTVEITIPNDGSVKPGDNLKVTDPEGNVVVDRPVTQDDIDKGKVVVPNIPVKPGNNTTTAEITNPNNPNNKGIGTGDIDENSEGSRKPTNPGVKYPEDKDGDGKISFDENKPNNGGDNTPNKTTVEITIPNDGSVKPGDNLKVTDPEGNVVVDRPVTQDDIDKGKVVVPNIPVKPGNNTTTAEITNPNNPNNKGIGTGDIDENSEGSRKPTNPGVKYPEDKDGDGKISFDENKPNNGGDNTPNKTTVEITIPNDGSVKPGDNLKVTDPEGNVVVDRPVTQDDIDKGKVVVPNIPVKPGNNTTTAEITNPNNPNNKGIGTGDIDENSEGSRKPTNPGVKYPEDKDGDGKISFDENKPNNGGDNTPNKTTVEITIPNDGSVKPGDNLKVTDPEGNVVVDRPVTQDDIDKGKVVVPNIPVKPGNNTTTAEITNPNNPNNKGIGTGDIDENSEGSRKPTNPGVKYPEDKDGDGKISFDENKPNNGGDNTPNKTTVEITIPNDGSVKPGDNLKVTDPEGNVVVDRPVTQDDIDKGKVVVPNIPVKPGNNTTTAEITNPNNPNNKGIGTGDIDENSEGSRKPTNPGVKYPEDKDGDGKISFDENKPNNGGDNTPNKTTVEITIPNDGSVKPGDNLKVTDPEGNVVVDRPVTQDDIDKGKVVVPNIPVKPGNNTTTAEITNPNNPNNKGIGTGDIDENSEGSRKPTNPGVKYPEDKDGDGKISFDENKPNNGGDNTPNKTTVEITIPNDGSVKPGDNLKVTDPEGNVVVDRPVTQDDIDKGKVVVPNIPVKPGNNTTTAEITNPNNPNNKGIGTGDIDENSEGSRKPTNPGVKYPEDKDGDGKISFDENKPNNGGDNTPNKTTVEITIPNDGSVKPGDNLKVTDPEGNVVVDRPVTQDDIDKGKVVVPNIPVKPGNNTTTAEITNPNNPNNKGIGTGDIDEDSTTSVTLTPKHDGTVEVISNDNDVTKVEISYTDNGGNTQTITVVKNPSAGWVVDSTPGKTTAPTGAFKLDPHSGRVTISDDATKDNTPVIAKATDGAGNTATGETTAPDKFTIKFNDDADGNGTITRGENYAEDGAKATATISIPNLAKDGSKIHVIGTGINDYYTVHKDASGNVTSVTDTKGNNVFDGDNGIKVSYDYNHYQTARGNAANITAELEGTTIKTTSSVKFENVGKAEVKFVELDEHGNVLNEKSDQITNQNRNIAMLDGDINHTTARISLPENVQDGDVVTVKYGYGPDAASLAKTGGKDTTAYKFFLVHKAADGSMTVDQITSATDKTPIKAGLTSTNGAGEKFGIDIADMPTASMNGTHSRGIEVSIKGDDRAEQSNGNTWISRDGMEAPKIEFIEGNKIYNPSISGSGSGALNAGISVADAIKDGDISHTTARITLPKVFSDGDKLTVAVTDYNKIYADTGVKQYPANNPEPTFVKAFIIHKATDGTVTFDEVDAAGNVTHAGIPALNNNAIEITGVPLYNMYENGVVKSDYVHATRVDATITDHLNLNGNDSASNVANYAFLANVNVVTITEVIDDVAGGIANGNIKDNDVVVNGVTKKGLTNDSTPTFKGKADPNSAVELYDGTTKIGSTTTDKFGNWSITPSTPLGEGAHSITASSPAANAIKASDPATITVDTSTKVTLDSVIDDVTGGVVNGNVKGNDVTVEGKTLKGLTNDNTPTLSGKAEAGSTVEIFDGTNKIGQVEAKGDGSWKFEVSTPLSDGEHELKVKTTDKAGNTAEVAPVTITVDTKIVDARVEFIEDKNNDGKFSWNENLTNEHPGRLSWKAIIPQDGSVKAGDIFHYKWDETGWHERPVSQAEIDRGYMGEMKNNQVQENGKIGVYGIGSNGDSYVAEAYFSDAAGNTGKKGKDEIVFDFTGAPRTKLDASAIYGNNDETFLFLDHGRKSDKDITEAANGKTVEIDVKTFTHGAKVKLDNGDDIVTINNKHGWGWINEDSKLDLGRGNNTLNVGKNIDKSTVTAGSGDDTVNVGNHITADSNINLGNGNNTITVGTNIDNSKVTTGSGNDVVTVGNWIREYSDINLGDGNNTLAVGNKIINSTVTTGYGNDTVKVKNAIIGTTVKLGAGDDTVEVGNKDITDNTLTGKSNIDGGDGYDKLTITNPGTTINLSNIASQAHNFEELNISNKGQNTTLSVKLSDVLSLADNDNTLKITADAGDKVEFKDAGWKKGESTNGYTAYTNDIGGRTVTVEIKDEVTQPM